MEVVDARAAGRPAALLAPPGAPPSPAGRGPLMRAGRRAGHARHLDATAVSDVRSRRGQQSYDHHAYAHGRTSPRSVREHNVHGAVHATAQPGVATAGAHTARAAMGAVAYATPPAATPPAATPSPSRGVSPPLRGGGLLVPPPMSAGRMRTVHGVYHLG
jgi:hypothetical protein